MSNDSVDSRAMSPINFHPLTTLNPVHTLPDELLFLIFFEVLGPVRSSNLRISMLLSHVCSRWRKILLHNPLFWASITVPPVAGAHLYALFPTQSGRLIIFCPNFQIAEGTAYRFLIC